MQLKLTGFVAFGMLYCSCAKQTGNNNLVSLSASSSQVSVGQMVTVTAHTGSNALSWTVTPSNAVSKAYTVTTEKTNYFSFLKAGDYVVGARTGSLQLDSMHDCDHADSIGHHIQDSLWNHQIDSLWVSHGLHKKDCRDGKDSASIHIRVQ